MKVAQTFVLIILIFIFSFLTNAQADCGYNFRLYVLDENGETINNAEVEFQNSKLKYFNDAKAYYFSDFGGCGIKKGLLKVVVEGFDRFEKEIGFRGFTGYELRLKAKESKKPAIFEELAVLRGSVKSENGETIPRVKITLTDEQGKISETLSNDNGYFDFIIDSGKYKLEFNGVAGFVPKIIENLELSKGYKNLDIVLEVKKRRSGKSRRTGN